MTDTGTAAGLPARILSPEERELERKRDELAGMEADLVERELELSTLQAALAAFEAEYLRVVGRRYAELDDIKARIAEAQAARHPADEGAREAASAARETADASAAQTADRAPQEPAPPFDPPADLKTMYRTIARKLHPDLASTDDERARRHDWMARVNDAYQQQDCDALTVLLADWEASPESVSGMGIASDLVRVIRQIAQVRRRIDDIDLAIETLKAGELHSLNEKCSARSETGGNLLGEMAARLDGEIAAARRELETLEAETL